MSITSGLSRLLAAFTDSRLRPHSKIAITGGAAIVVVAGGLLTLDVPEVMAQGGLFGALFGDGSPHAHLYIVEPLHYYPGSGWRSRHHAGHPAAHRHAHRFKHERYAGRHGRHLIAQRAAAPIIAKATTPFIAKKVAALPVFRRAAAEVEPFAAGDAKPLAERKPHVALSRAVMPTGQKAAAAAPTTVKTSESDAAFNDPTLRKGDSVVTSSGVFVFKGGSFPHKNSDFMSLAETRGLSPDKQSALAAIERALKTPHGRAALLSEERRSRRQVGSAYQ